MTILNGFANTHHNQDTTDQRGPARAKTRNRIKTRHLGFLLIVLLAGLLLWPTSAMAQQSTAADGPAMPAVVSETAPLTGIVQIATGADHTCVLIENDGAMCWGSNSAGQLGDRTTEYRYTPVDVFGLGNGVTAIAAGGPRTCALTEHGGVQCWGRGHFSEESTATTRSFTMPDQAHTVSVIYELRDDLSSTFFPLVAK